MVLPRWILSLAGLSVRLGGCCAQTPIFCDPTNADSKCPASPGGTPENCPADSPSCWSAGNDRLCPCTPVQCTESPARHTDGSCIGKIANEHCTAKCQAGYKNKGGSSAYTCTWGVNHNSASWTGGDLSCEREDSVQCQAVAPAPNTETCSQTLVGGKCTAQCLPNFAPSGSAAYTCGSDGTWQGGHLQCEKIYCDQLPAPNADGSCKHTPAGQPCEATCAEGYEQKGGTNKYMCTQDAANKAQCDWASAESGGKLVCSGVECSGAPVTNAETCGTGHYGDGKTCTATCKPGFELSGNPEFTCDANGHWAGAPGGLRCTEQAQCKAEAPAEHAEKCQPGPAGTNCTAQCLPNFAPSGSAAYTCGNDGKWQGGNLQCREIHCDKLPAPHTDGSCKHTAAGQQCAATCAAGYERTGGTAKYRCTQDVRDKAHCDWTPEESGGKLVCSGVECNGAPVAGAETCGTGHYGDGKNCTATCKPGFELSGNPEYTCDANGHWAGGGLKCKEIVPLSLKCTPAMRKELRNFSADCVNVTFALGLVPADQQTKVALWQEGLRMYMNHTNRNGGLRLGANKVGYVDVKIQQLKQGQRSELVDLYRRWASDPYVTVLLAPLDSENTGYVLQALGKQLTDDRAVPSKIVLSGQSYHGNEEYPNVWSVYGNGKSWDADAITLLTNLGARTFTISAKDSHEQQQDSLSNLIRANNRSKLLQSGCASASTLEKQLALAHEKKPDVFIALGDIGTFRQVLEYFKTYKYAPKGAFFSGGLLATPAVCDDAYFIADCKECYIFDRWMGSKAWSRKIPNAGPPVLPKGLPDPYGMADGDGVLRPSARVRYFGSALQFDDLAQSWLKTAGTDPAHQPLASGGTPTAYHAQAVASLLLLQLAIELAPEAEGHGLSFEKLFQGPRMQNETSPISTAMRTLNISTFWGRMQPGADGRNAAFKGHFAHFPESQLNPKTLTKEPDHKAQTPQLLGVGDRVAYPVKWPCELDDSCSIFHKMQKQLGERFWLCMGGGGAVLLALLICLCCGCRRIWRRRCSAKRSRSDFSMHNLLRESLLSTTELPDAALASQDVDARWVETARKQQLEQSVSFSGHRSMRSMSVSTPSTPLAPMDEDSQLRPSPLAHSVSGGFASTKVMRRLKNPFSADDSPRFVMFSNAHLAELLPKPSGDGGGGGGWNTQLIGRGASATVYHAKWRGQDVAVKEFSLPVEPHNAGARAQAVFKQQLKQTIRNYVNEVELNCELAHPNVVRLLGYATQPRLLLVQELLRGQSLDKQLYVEGWKPSVAQILKVALDIACGMRYLHTTWVKPIIHRDLKSPNLMLVAAPPVPGESAGSDDLHCADGTPLMVKITDFGLSRDKAERGVSQSTMHGDSLLAQTAIMTVCGSTLWMAPEILLGNSSPFGPYNEKVDTYSYAMCLVELVSLQLPWHGYGGTAEVPLKVTRGERPEAQLQRVAHLADLQPLVGRGGLVQRCWVQDPAQRPDFATIEAEVEAMLRGRNSMTIGGSD